MNLKKEHGRWEAETFIHLKNKLYLSINTYKFSQLLITSGSVLYIDEDGCKFYPNPKRHFRPTWLAVEYTKRVTAKLVESQHNSVDIDLLVLQANRFYDSVDTDSVLCF